MLACTAILIDALDDSDLRRANADTGSGTFPDERASGWQFVAPLYQEIREMFQVLASIEVRRPKYAPHKWSARALIHDAQEIRGQVVRECIRGSARFKNPFWLAAEQVEADPSNREAVVERKAPA